MMRLLATAVALIVGFFFCGIGHAQQLPPGFVDPGPVLNAAEAAIGATQLRCLTVAGDAYAAMVGQQRLAGYDVDWPRGKPLASYTRSMDWERRIMVETFDREPGHNPAGWKHGLGWRGGTPIQRHHEQTFIVSGPDAWHIDGPNGTPVAAHPRDAELWQLDLWMNPHGFLKAARLPDANPRATWRWELGEMGRDGATTIPEKVTVVSITILGKYRVDATINAQHLLQRIHTWVPDPVLGDTNYEHEFTNASYVDVGNGIRVPTRWHSHTGWDDNYQAHNHSAGRNGFGGTLAEVRPNACVGTVDVPATVSGGPRPTPVVSEELADGVWLLGGSSHNSVAVEFDDYIAVVEAPLDEAWNLSVIDEIVKMIPDKPIRYLVNTHQHHDHIGGLRTYMHIGATIITHVKNYDFYRRDVLNFSPRTLEPDMMSLWPPTEVAEGYQYETVRENYVLTDGRRTMHISYVQPLPHVEGMLMAYLPGERMVIQADLFDSPTEGETPAPTDTTRSFHRHVERLGLDVETVVPVHGRPTPWADVERIINDQ